MMLKDNDYYFQSRLEVLSHVPPSVSRLLDIGCGGGAFAGELKKRQKAEVWGVELDPSIAEQARSKLDRLFIGDIVKLAGDLPDGYFDCIICNDVLEHIYDPYELLAQLKKKLNKSGLLICSIPNIRFIRVMKDLLFKKEWEYTKAGIMDFTHVRFFTRKSVVNMFERLDCRVLDIVGLNPKKVDIGFWLLNALTGGLLEDMRFPQFLFKVSLKSS